MKFNDIHITSNVKPISEMIGKIKEIKSKYDGDNRDNIVSSLRINVLEDYSKIHAINHIDNRLKQQQKSKILDENTINIFNSIDSIRNSFDCIDEIQYNHLIKESHSEIDDMMFSSDIDDIVNKMMKVLTQVNSKVNDLDEYVEEDIDSVKMFENRTQEYSKCNLLEEFGGDEVASNYFIRLELISFDDKASFIPAYSYFVNVACRATNVAEAKDIFKHNVEKSLGYINKKVNETVQTRNDRWIDQVNVYKGFDSFVAETRATNSQYVSTGVWFQSRGSKTPEISCFKYVRLDKTMVSRYMDGE